MRRAWRAFDEAVFGYGSPTTIGVLRALIGFWALVSLAMLTVAAPTWFSAQGMTPSSVMDIAAGGHLLDPLSATDSMSVVYVVLGVGMVAAALTCVGLFSRLSSAALALVIVILHTRCVLVLNSGDTLLRQCVLILALAPSGAAFSLDRLRAGGPAPRVSLWPQRAFQWQLAVVYFTTVWFKWMGPEWRDGTATYYPPQVAELVRFPAPTWFDRPPMIQITTYGTLVIELALATLVFSKPCRKWVLLAGLALHGAIEYRFNIPLFAFIITSCYVAFYSGEEVEGWWRRLRRRQAAPA